MVWAESAGYHHHMRDLRFILRVLVALLALLAPTLTAAACGAMGESRPSLRIEAAQSGHLPSPCEMQGGKRVAPAFASVALPKLSELPRAMHAQWVAGLADDLMRHGRLPATDVPPPRFA
jgi:hypothetical protein